MDRRNVTEDDTILYDLAEKCPVGVFLFQSGRLKYVNQSLASMHGYTVDEIRRVSREDLIHPEDLQKIDEHVVKLTSNEPVPRKLIFRGIKKGGEAVYIENHDCRLTTSQGHSAIIGTAMDITERLKTEEELRQSRERLEELIAERTLQLSELNERLLDDIQKRIDVEKALEIKSINLTEANTALKVLLRQRDEDRRELEEAFSSNVKELVLRFTHMLRDTRLDENQALLVDIVEQNLRDMISTFPERMNTFGFTPKEMEIIFLLRQGTTSKQIAKLLNVTMDAVNRHRYHIRKKLGVNKKKSNLRVHLMSLES